MNTSRCANSPVRLPRSRVSPLPSRSWFAYLHSHAHTYVVRIHPLPPWHERTFFTHGRSILHLSYQDVFTLSIGAVIKKKKKRAFVTLVNYCAQPDNHVSTRQQEIRTRKKQLAEGSLKTKSRPSARSVAEAWNKQKEKTDFSLLGKPSRPCVAKFLQSTI